MPFEKNYVQFLTKFPLACVAFPQNRKMSKGCKNKLKGRTLAMSDLEYSFDYYIQS